MFKEGPLDKTLRTIKGFIPKPVFDFFKPFYHGALSWTGAVRYGFPSLKLKVIGITGTKGKSTTVYLTAKALEAGGASVAAIGSLGYKIKDKEWPNTLKMTMPGRWKMQKFLRQAADAGCDFVVMECPSEGLAQGRHFGVQFDAAVFLNIHPEHIEAHGGFDNYLAAKQILFKACHHIHIVNADDPKAGVFSRFPADKHITFGIAGGDVRAEDIDADAHHAHFRVGHAFVRLKLGGIFNVSNALAALTVAQAYGVPVAAAAKALESVDHIAGRMQWLQREPFGVVVDYAHTPDSLKAVYRTLRPANGRLIAVLGAAGGGRDIWKRPEFGAIAAQYCDRIILTDEDPFEENPDGILDQIEKGIPPAAHDRVTRIMDRRGAIAEALTKAQENDIVVITGKGSETSMALAGGRKIPWSDAAIVRELLKAR